MAISVRAHNIAVTDKSPNWAWGKLPRSVRPFMETSTKKAASVDTLSLTFARHPPALWWSSLRSRLLQTLGSLFLSDHQGYLSFLLVSCDMHHYLPSSHFSSMRLIKLNNREEVEVMWRMMHFKEALQLFTDNCLWTSVSTQTEATQLSKIKNSRTLYKHVQMLCVVILETLCQPGLTQSVAGNMSQSFFNHVDATRILWCETKKWPTPEPGYERVNL